MTVKEYLSQAYRIDQRINSKLEQVASLRALATKATSTLSDTPPSGSRNVQSMENVIVKIIDLENEINEDIDTLVDLKREIVGVIKRIDNPEYQTLLELRYLCFYSWEKVAVEMEYDLRYLHKLHRKALEQCSAFGEDKSAFQVRHTLFFFTLLSLLWPCIKDSAFRQEKYRKTGSQPSVHSPERGWKNMRSLRRKES